MKSLLTRDKFRESVFHRDGHTCIVPGCGRTMLNPDDKRFNAHHIYERRLWMAREEQGGYFQDNGVTVCDDPHHMLAERNVIPPQAFHRWLGIKEWPLPAMLQGMSHTFADTERTVPQDFDKWGMKLAMPMKDGTGIKYPSSLYLPFSPGHKEGHEDTLKTLEHLVGVPLVVTTKMDGSNVKMVGGAEGYVASRAGHAVSASHPSFAYLKRLFHEEYQWRIPEGLVVFGEWLFARHSIAYEGNLALPSYFQVFAAYDPDYRLFLEWDEVQEVAKTLGVPTVPVIKRVTYDAAWKLQQDVETMAWQQVEQGHEGLVVRSAYPIHYGHFQQWLAKWVRPNHVQTDDAHWSAQPVTKNEIMHSRGG